MAYTFSQAAHHVSNSGSSATIGAGDGLSSTGAGNLLVAYVGTTSNSTSTITMPTGWVDCGDGFVAAGSSGVYALGKMFYYPNNPGGITSVLASCNGSDGLNAQLIEFSGAPATITIRGHAYTGLSHGVYPASVSALTNDLVVFSTNCAATGGYGTDSGWTQEKFTYGSWGGSFLNEYQIISSGGTITPGVASAGSTTVSFIVAFEGAIVDPYPLGYGPNPVNSILLRM